MLKEEEFLALRVLSGDVDIKSAKRFIREAGSRTSKLDRENADAILQVSVSANKKLYSEIRGDSGMCDALRELMKDEIAKDTDAARKAGSEEAQLSAIRSIMETMS